MSYVIRRISFYLVAFWAAITMAFFLPRMMPGDPAQQLIARFQGRIDPRALDSLRLQFGIGQHISLWQQYLNYLGDFFHGNLGISIKDYPTPVSDILAQAVPWTIGLIGVASVISFCLGTFLGMVAAWRRGSPFDRTMAPLLTFLSAVPYFYIALMFLYFLAFKTSLFPLMGAFGLDSNPSDGLFYWFDIIYHAILPATTIIIVSLAGWMLGMRNAMLNTLSEDYVLMAEAKGLPDRRVMIWYAARNAILPNVTGFALSLGFVIGGSLIMEQVFSYPGIGYTLIQAVQAEDYPLMQALFVIIAACVLIANFVADLVYAFIDPRVRQQKG
jgi:peptide/nickel transport system permease protein